MSNINLDGGDVNIIRALGFSGTQMSGYELKMRIERMSNDDLAEALKMLVSLGYVTSTPEMDGSEEIDQIQFAVNSGYAKALHEAIEPTKEPNKRVRRQ